MLKWSPHWPSSSYLILINTSITAIFTHFTIFSIFSLFLSFSVFFLFSVFFSVFLDSHFSFQYHFSMISLTFGMVLSMLLRLSHMLSTIVSSSFFFFTACFQSRSPSSLCTSTISLVVGRVLVFLPVGTIRWHVTSSAEKCMPPDGFYFLLRSRRRDARHLFDGKFLISTVATEKTSKEKN